MTLAGLLPALASHAHAGLRVSGLCLDSRCVQPGDAFLAVGGSRFDGRAFIAQAVAAGASAVLVEPAAGREHDRVEQGVPVIVVEKLAMQMGHIASRFYGEPSCALCVTGVTGTNGKTTVTQLLAQLSGLLGGSPAVMGTLGWGVPGRLQASTHTTPDAITVQQQLACLRDQHVESVFMEVSSHALDQWRVGGVMFETAVFTNLSRDHLDYHGDMGVYEQAKSTLFTWPGLHHAVINADDAAGRRLLVRLDASVQRLTYSTDDASADVYAVDIACTPAGVQAKVHTPWGQGTLHCRLLGEFNVSNALAAIAVLGLQGYSLDRVLQSFESVTPIVGRLELVAVHHGVSIVVDYAHTPDALEKALQALRQHTAGQLHVVFGCGGERDTGKRPLMGAVAARLADTVTITSDNPRHELPTAIMNAIADGMPDTDQAVMIEDRAEAVHAVLNSAVAGDVVVIAGKGHETWQQVGDEKRPFSDHAVVHAWLASRGRA